MLDGKHFSFESVTFEQGLAHDGQRPIHFRRVMDRQSGSAANFVDLAIVPVGADIGRHTHGADEEEMYVIVAGRGTMHLDGQDFEVGPGHVIINRPGGTHALRNSGDVELRLVVVEVQTHQ